MTESEQMFGTSTYRWLAICAAALLALTLLPAIALGQEPVDDPEDACPEDPPPAPFTDRDDIPEVHVRNVDCAAHRGIVEGFQDGTYRPALPVTRDGMASFIARTLRAAGFELPPPEDHPGFADTDGNVHEDNIRSLAAAQIVLGGPEELPPTHYGPRRVTRRDQMTSFLIRAAEWAWAELHGTPADFGSSDQQFDDVPPGNVHFRNVNGAAEFNLTVGRQPGVFDPAMSTRRDQMASFTARLLVFLESFEEPVDETPEPTPEETPEATFTAAPELIAAEHVETTVDGDVDVRFFFDTEIDSDDVVAGNFHLHTVFGDNIPGDSADRDEDDTNAAIVRFNDAEDDFDVVTVAAVDHEAVMGIDEEEDQTQPNPEGSVPFPDEDDGTTVAPVLVQVIISDEDNGEREIVFVFDASLDDTQAIDAGDFALYDEDGERTELTDCDYGVEDNHVECTVTQSPFAPVITDPEFEAAAVAVLGGVASETVTTDEPPTGTDPQNHGDSEPVDRPVGQQD